MGLHILFRRMLIHQQNILKNITEKTQDYYHSRFEGQAVSNLICINCKKPAKDDDEPRWAVYNPGCYIVRQRLCNSKGCKEGFLTKPTNMDENKYTLLRPRDLVFPVRSQSTLNLEDYWETSKDSRIETMCIGCHTRHTDSEPRSISLCGEVYTMRELCPKSRETTQKRHKQTSHTGGSKHLVYNQVRSPGLPSQMV